MSKPAVNSLGQRELDQAQEKFDKFEKEIKDLTLDRMNEAPMEEHEPQTKLSSKQFHEAPEIYLKPSRTIDPPVNAKKGIMQDKFNEKWRETYDYDRKYVRFIAENIEILGEDLTVWTRPYPGMPAEMWIVPVNVPIWGPRYLAEQIRRKCYHRLSMAANKQVGCDGAGTYVGAMVVDNILHRLNAQAAPKVQISFNRKVSNF